MAAFAVSSSPYHCRLLGPENATSTARSTLQQHRRWGSTAFPHLKSSWGTLSGNSRNAPTIINRSKGYCHASSLPGHGRTGFQARPVTTRKLRDISCGANIQPIRHCNNLPYQKVDVANIRNFSIIAHIDHGKSTLADTLLLRTGTVPEREMKEQFMDGMDLERERGITIKLQAARMRYTREGGEEFCLNLIDTPGHVDFSYEVSRSLAACEGALLVVDASQGVEAQTLANVYLAMENNLEIIPIINKIDLPGADPDRAKAEIEEIIGLDCSKAILCSAKNGIGMDEILEAIVTRIPAPVDTRDKPLRCLIFDSYYDPYRGVVVYFRVVDGTIRKGDKVLLMTSKKEYEVDELGVRAPMDVQVDELGPGEVGYLSAQIRAVMDARVGDTITSLSNPAPERLAGYQQAVPMVFCGLFPTDADQYADLRDALLKLQLNDAALKFEPEVSSAMGFGFRCGFLGLLHMEIVQERLEREYDLDLITTAPGVVYRVTTSDGEVISRCFSTIHHPGKRATNHQQEALTSYPTCCHHVVALLAIHAPLFLPRPLPENGGQPVRPPPPSRQTIIEEPYVRLEVITPGEYVGTLMELSQARRGIFKDMKYMTETRTSLVYEVPLAEVVTDYFDIMKSRTKGYGSMEYHVIGFRANDLVKLDVRINGDLCEPLSTIVHNDKAYDVGKALVNKLKDLIPRQQFRVPIQACIGTKAIASTAISAMRKDVLAKCYGGDISRKKKLLKKQAAGKKRMKSIGKVDVPQEAFMAVLKLDSESS
eukprot:jgi/Mesvir1/8830/Mv02731-RA.1